MGVFYDTPMPGREEKLRSEIGIPIFGKADPTEEVKIRDVPAMDVATISHRGPSREYPKTYRELSAWIEEHGYEWVGPSMEIYTKKPEIRGKETVVFAKIEAPVRKKKR